MDVIGVGAQDDLAYAKRFVNDTGTSFTMLWSDSSAPWRHFSVAANSSVLLLDKGGNRTGYGPRSFNASSVSTALSNLG